MAATLTDSGELTYFSIPIEKTEVTADGDVLVYGKATDGTVDSDEQIVDPDWSASALQHWLDTAGNVRVQHNPQRDPAGKGLKVEPGPDGHYVKSLIVEPVAKELVKKGVLTAYSVGIARPTIARDVRARGGRIIDGHIVELSLVDRPANKNCGIALVKAASDGSPEWVGKVWGADSLITKSSGMVNLEVPEDVSMSFSPSDLAKIISTRNGSVGHPDLEKSKLTAARENKIPGGDFAYVSGSGERKLPVHDASHTRNAMARWNQTQFESPEKRSKAARKILSRARRFGIEIDQSSGIAQAASGGKAKKAEDMADELIMQAGIEAAEKAGRTLAVNDRDDDDSDSEAQDLGDGAEEADGGQKSSIPDEIKAAMRFRGLGLPHDLGVLHDLTCPAFDPAAVDKCYPMNSFATIDDGYWQRQAMDLAANGNLDDAVKMTGLWELAQVLKTADPYDMYVLRQQLHKAFQDANPGPGRAPIPSGQIKPGSYNRPYISGGHSAPSSGQDSPNSAKVPSGPMQGPGSYGRGYISAGHADDSPASRGTIPSVPTPGTTGKLTPANLGSVPRSSLIDAMGTLHSAVASSAPDVCPLKPEEDFNYARTAVPSPGSPATAATPGASKSDSNSDADEAVVKANKKAKGKKGKKSLPPWLQDDDQANAKKKKSIPAASKSSSNVDDDDDDDDDADSNDQPDRDEKNQATSDLDKGSREGSFTTDDILQIVKPLLKSKTPRTTQHSVQPSSSDVELRDLARRLEKAETTRDVENITAPLMKRLDQNDASKELRAIIKPLRRKMQSLETERQQEIYKQQLAQYEQKLQVLQQQLPSQQQPVQLQDQLKQLQELQKQITETSKPPQPEVTRREIREATRPILKRLDSLSRAEKRAAPAPASASSALDQDAIAEALKPLLDRIALQDKRLWKQERRLQKQQMNKALKAEEAPAVPEMPADVVTKDELSQWAAPLLNRMQSQEEFIRKQTKQLIKSQKRPNNIPDLVLPPLPQPPPPPAPSTDFMTLEAIDELARKLDSQPSITKEDLSDFTDRLVSRMQAQPGVTRETLEEVIEKLENRVDAVPSGVTKEALAEITEKLEHRLDQVQNAQESLIGKQAEDQMRGMLEPLMKRINDQDKQLRKQAKRIRKQNLPVVTQPILPIPQDPYVAKMNRPSMDYELRRRFEEQSNLIRKQERQLKRQEKLLNAVPELERAVNALASLPDPHTVAYKGGSVNGDINKSSADLAGAQSMASIAERTQAMMLSEWETQFRTSPDPAQREVAWRHIIQMRGLADKD